MSIDFGSVKTYKSRGFGFVKSVSRGEIFFHIKKVTNREAKEYLENNADNSDDGYDLCFWYTVEKTSKGNQASKMWSSSRDVPLELLFPFIDNVIKRNSQLYRRAELTKLFSQLFTDERIPDAKLNTFLGLAFFIENPDVVLSFLRQSQMDLYIDVLNLPSRWKDLSVEIPSWIEEVTKHLLGKEQLGILKIERHLAEEEKKALDAELAIQRQAEERARKATKIAHLVRKYRANPSGIRSDAEMHSVCLVCSSQNVRARSQREHYFQVCQDCGTEWYVNHCWNCQSRVDSRDPDTPPCSVCGWYKCKDCGACRHIGGCSTNPYDNYEQQIPF